MNGDSVVQEDNSDEIEEGELECLIDEANKTVEVPNEYEVQSVSLSHIEDERMRFGLRGCWYEHHDPYEIPFEYLVDSDESFFSDSIPLVPPAKNFRPWSNLDDSVDVACYYCWLVYILITSLLLLI